MPLVQQIKQARREVFACASDDWYNKIEPQ